MINLTLDEKLQLLADLALERMVLIDRKLEFTELYSTPQQWGALLNQQLLSRFNLTEQVLPQTLEHSEPLMALVDELSQTYSEDLQRLTTGLKLHAGKLSSATKELRTFIIILVVLFSTKIEFKNEDGNLSFDASYQPTEQLIQSVMKIVSSMANPLPTNKREKQPAKDKKQVSD